MWSPLHSRSKPPASSGFVYGARDAKHAVALICVHTQRPRGRSIIICVAFTHILVFSATRRNWQRAKESQVIDPQLFLVTTIRCNIHPLTMHNFFDDLGQFKVEWSENESVRKKATQKHTWLQVDASSLLVLFLNGISEPAVLKKITEIDW